MRSRIGLVPRVPYARCVGSSGRVVVLVVAGLLFGCSNGHGPDTASRSVADGVQLVTGTELVAEPIPVLSQAPSKGQKEWSAVLRVHEPAPTVYRRFVGEARRLGLAGMRPSSEACTSPSLGTLTGQQTPETQRSLVHQCQGRAEDGTRRLDVSVTTCGGCAEQGAVLWWHGPGRYASAETTIHHEGTNTLNTRGWVLLGATLSGVGLDVGECSDRTITVLEITGDPARVRARYIDAMLFGGSLDVQQRSSRVGGVHVRQFAFGWTGGDTRLSFLDAARFAHPVVAVEGCNDA